MSEVALRVAWTPPSLTSTQAFEGHEVYGVAPIPGISGTRTTVEYTHTFSHTLQGFRSGAIVQPANAAARNLPRLLFLGDSFTYGLGSSDDEIFVNLIARELGEAEVLNGGVNGFGQRDQLALLDAIGEDLRPNLVVVMFFWNDLEDNMKGDRPTFAVENGRVVRTDKRVAESFEPLALRQSRELELPQADSLLYYTREMLKEGLKGFRYRYLGISRRDITNETELAAAWAATSELMRAIELRARELGARLLVVSIPDHNKVNPSAVIKNIEPINFDIEKGLRDTLAPLRIEYVDLYEPLRAAFEAGDLDLYYYADRHLTPRGNRVVADALAPLIKQRLDAAFENSVSGSPGSLITGPLD